MVAIWPALQLEPDVVAGSGVVDKDLDELSIRHAHDADRAVHVDVRADLHRHNGCIYDGYRFGWDVEYLQDVIAKDRGSVRCKGAGGGDGLGEAAVGVRRELDVLGSAVGSDVALKAVFALQPVPEAVRRVAEALAFCALAIASSVIVAVASQVAERTPESKETVRALGARERSSIGNFAGTVSILVAHGVLILEFYAAILRCAVVGAIGAIPIYVAGTRAVAFSAVEADPMGAANPLLDVCVEVISRASNLAALTCVERPTDAVVL